MPDFTPAQQTDALISSQNAYAYLDDMREQIFAAAIKTGGMAPVPAILDYNREAVRATKAAQGLLSALRKRFPEAASILPTKAPALPRFVAIGGAKLAGEFIAVTSLGLDSSPLAGLGAAAPRAVKGLVAKGAQEFDFLRLAKVTGGVLLVGGAVALSFQAVYWLTGSQRAAALDAENRANIFNQSMYVWKAAMDSCLAAGGSPGECGAQANRERGAFIKSSKFDTPLGFVETVGWMLLAGVGVIAAYRVGLRYRNRQWPFEQRGGGAGMMLPAYAGGRSARSAYTADTDDDDE
jgi:hypothetical protein